METSVKSTADCLEVKSAKQWVTDVANEQLAKVIWETTQENPGCYPPKFLSRCVFVYEVEATGKTKEEAEQEAAMLLLTEKLKLTSLPLMELTEPPSSDETEPADVSETDDFELEEIRNPIGELMTRFEKKKLLDLQFLAAEPEGPHHRKIFTVTCTAKMLDGRVITFAGRRYSKKLAKKIAAVRVLREVNVVEESYDYQNDPSQLTIGATGGDEILKALKKASKKKMKRRTEAAAYDCIPTLEAKLKHYCKPCENDDLSCPDLLEDFHHVFAHVKERETLEQILEVDNVTDFVDGPLVVLQHLAQEIGLQLNFSKPYLKPPNTGLPYLMLLELMFEVNIGCQVPMINKKVVHGVGYTEECAKENAAKAALDYIRGEPNFIEISRIPNI